MIEIENVSVKYRTENDIYTAIANVNLVIPDGGTCAVIGQAVGTAAAIAALDGLPGETSFLRNLARDLVMRTA